MKLLEQVQADVRVQQLVQRCALEHDPVASRAPGDDQARHARAVEAAEFAGSAMSCGKKPCKDLMARLELEVRARENGLASTTARMLAAFHREHHGQS